MTNSENALDLYASIEDMLHNDDAIAELQDLYVQKLSGLSFETLLDVGCGSGQFLKRVKEQFGSSRLKGIDLSMSMVEKARLLGVDAEHKELCNVDGRYDVLTAVFDMINYLSKAELKSFFECARERLSTDGVFIFDINTEFGFSDVATGIFFAEDEGRSLVVQSQYDDQKRYISEFVLFEKREERRYSRSTQSIIQHYHSVEELERISGMKLVDRLDMQLYELGEPDKTLVVLQKTK